MEPQTDYGVELEAVIMIATDPPYEETAAESGKATHIEVAIRLSEVLITAECDRLARSGQNDLVDQLVLDQLILRSRLDDVAGARSVLASYLAIDDLSGAHASRVTTALLRLLREAARPAFAIDVLLPVFDDKGPELANWLGSGFVDVLCEVGNAMRACGGYTSAESVYRKAEAVAHRYPRGTTSADLMTLRRNRAIVLLQSGRPAVARRVLAAALAIDEFDDHQLALVRSSLASCQMLLGQFEVALVGINEALACEELTAQERDSLLVSRAQCMAALAHPATAESIDAAQAELDPDSFLQAMLAAIGATYASHHDLPDAAARIEAALTSLQSAERRIETNVEQAGQIFGLRVNLLLQSGRYHEVVTETDGLAPVDWRLITIRALAMSELGVDTWRRDANHAALALIKARADDNIAVTDVGLMRDAPPLQNALVRAATRDLQSGEINLFNLLLAGELASSVGGSLSAFRSIDQDVVEVFGKLGMLEVVPDRTTILYAMADDADVHLVALRRDSVAYRGKWSLQEIDRLRRRVLSKASRLDPQTGDLFRDIPSWKPFAETLGEAIRPCLRDEDEMCVFGGSALANLPLHTALIDGRPLCFSNPIAFIPSLLVLYAQRTRPPPNRSGAAVFSTPSALDQQTTVERFRAGATEVLEALRQLYGGEYIRHHDGVSANRDALRAALTSVELLVLCCHGKVNRREGVHGWEIAVGDALPRLDETTKADTARASLFLWDEIDGPTPPIVLSGACGSGSASYAIGGERVSLDRALIAGGTQLFAGPLWDVVIDAGHHLLAQLLHRSQFATSWADAWRQVLSYDCDDVPAATWQAFMLNGDWRYSYE
jgi:tetratricopeptide (TPR) repeat protein